MLLHYFGLFSFSVAFTEKSFIFQGHLLTFKGVNVVGVVFKLKTKRVMYTAETETDGRVVLCVIHEFTAVAVSQWRSSCFLFSELRHILSSPPLIKL